MIEGTDDGAGKRQYTLTDAGRERVANQDPDAPMPWSEAATPSVRGELRSAVAELTGQVHQIGRFGTDDQQAAASTVLAAAKSELYAILAQPSSTSE